nr:hypothetical protein [Tanacetum cinerariifolium]
MYKVDELRAISGHMLRAASVQIPENNLDNLHSISKEETLKLVDPQEFLVLSVLLTIGIGSLRCTIAVVAILVKGHTFPTNEKVHPVDLRLAFTELMYASTHESWLSENKHPLHVAHLKSALTFNLEFITDAMALVSTTLFFLFKLGLTVLWWSSNLFFLSLLGAR